MMEFKGLTTQQETTRGVPSTPRAPREIERIMDLLDKASALSRGIKDKVDQVIAPEPEIQSDKSPEPQYIVDILASRLHMIIGILDKANESLSRFI